MSERDLPSRVDSERTIPSSKSVPALHQIHSPNSEQPRTNHETFNPGYSRTSSNNSINNNNPPQNTHNGPLNNPAGLRSRSTHNLLQQDGGFYQNLSIYRNKIPSPQHLGDRWVLLYNPWILIIHKFKIVYFMLTVFSFQDFCIEKLPKLATFIGR